MDDLVAFLRARLDEEARRAEMATPGPWRADIDEEVVFAGDEVVARMRDFNRAMSNAQVEADTTIIAVHADPARVLREVAAKRRILSDELDRALDAGRTESDLTRSQLVRLLALPYSDHPDYRPEWAPDA